LANGSPVLRKPRNPRAFADWSQGSFPGTQASGGASAPLQVVRRSYGTAREWDSLVTLAHQFAGQWMEDARAFVPPTLTWRDLAILNYGTDHPYELNWYFRYFHESKKTDDKGEFYLLTSDDANSFLYLPLTSTKGGTTVNVPPSPGVVVLQLPPPSSPLTRLLERRWGDIDADTDGLVTTTASQVTPNPSDPDTLVPETSGIRALLGSSAFVGDEVAAVAVLIQVLSGARYDGYGSAWAGTVVNITNAHLVRADRSALNAQSGQRDGTLMTLSALFDQFFAYYPGKTPPATIADVIAQVALAAQSADPPADWTPPSLPDAISSGPSDLLGAMAGLTDASTVGLHSGFEANKATLSFIGAGLFPPSDDPPPPAFQRQEGQ
jgi:hypothetical protein